jgi:two-component sensor histidine kinase
VRSSQAASIGLIVNELVTNCFKYAFPEGRRGAVEVDVRAKDDRIVGPYRTTASAVRSKSRAGSARG